MGEDKALKLFLGRPLIQRVVDQMKPIAHEMIVTTNHPEGYEFLNLRLVPDIFPDRGALGGLYTALSAATFPLVAVVACDMPFASATFFQIAEAIMTREGADVVIAKTEEGFEPLHALYRRDTCLPAIKGAIALNQWRVISWFPKVRVRLIEQAEMDLPDKSGLCFWNLNTPEEFLEAERRAKEAGSEPA